MLYFKIDGKCRTKLGLPPTSAVGYAASYDTEKSVLTILKYIGPEEDALYVNSQWGEQENPFDGDVINSYSRSCQGTVRRGTGENNRDVCKIINHEQRQNNSKRNTLAIYFADYAVFCVGCSKQLDGYDVG